MHNHTNVPIVILGAGLAGLSAAYHLSSPYEVFEKESDPGGAARSFTVNGFTFDYAVHILYTKDPYASWLIQELLGPNFTRQQRSSWVCSHDVHTRYPYQANTFGLPVGVIEENILGLIEALYAPSVAPPRNFAEWFQATFGQGFARNFMIPFNRKVWATDPVNMGFQWIEGRVLTPRLEEALEGAFSEQEKGFGPNAEFWYPREGGTGALPRSFLPHVRNLHLNAPAQRLDVDRHCVTFADASTVHYSRLITSLPLPLLIEMLDSVPASVGKASRQLRCNRVITVNLGVNRPQISDKHWVYYPEEKYVFQRLSLPMNFAPSLVPPDTSSILVEISASEERPIDESAAVESTIRGLMDAKLLRADDELAVRDMRVIDPAYVIYDSHHREAVDTIHAYLHKNDIIACGRFGDWEYLNMDQAILSGKRAAEAATA